MYQGTFQFPKGTEVEFTLSRNKAFDHLILRGKIIHYFRRPGKQTILQRGRLKSYPVDIVQIETNSGKIMVDVNCIITKPTQEIVDEINRAAEAAIEMKSNDTNGSFKLKDVARKSVMWAYVASKNSKLFHTAGSVNAKRIVIENMVGFKNKAEAEASGRKHGGE
jgi:hypothetical protein